jgi:hypothetical protein
VNVLENDPKTHIKLAIIPEMDYQAAIIVQHISTRRLKAAEKERL